MAMPASGTIAMISAPQSCGSICATVCGNHPGGNRCLSGMVAKIGCGSPYRMSCFYNVSNDIIVTPNPLTGIIATCTTCTEKICGPSWNSVDIVSNCNWIVIPATPINPAASPGANANVVICANAGAARQGSATYTPQGGGTNTVTFCQVVATSMHCIYAAQISDSCCSTCELRCSRFQSTPAMGGTDCYNITLSWNIVKSCTPAVPTNDYMCIMCNGTIKAQCSISSKLNFNCTGTLSSFTVCSGDLIDVVTEAQVNCTAESSYADVYLSNVACVSGHGCYCIGSPSIACAQAGAIA